MSSASRRILFVCTGNICRSPIADVIASTLNDDDRFSFASAGTASWHVGEPMDPRAAAVLSDHGFDPSRHRAQHATKAILEHHDIILGLDRKHLQILRGQVDHGSIRLELLRSFDPGSGGQHDIADPYYGQDPGFVECFDTVHTSVRGLLEALQSGGL